MSNIKSPESEPNLESYDYGERFYVHTAKGAIEGLSQVLAEAGTNEDEAIHVRSKRDGTPDAGRITFAYSPDSQELTITGDGTGMTVDEMRGRLLRVGTEAQEGSRRGFFHRGIREAFIAMGGGEITSIGKLPDGTEVVSRARFELRGIAFLVEDAAPTDAVRAGLGLTSTGTSVKIPLGRLVKARPKDFEFGAIERQIQNCVGLRTILLDEHRTVELNYAGEPPRRVKFSYPDGEVLVSPTEVTICGQRGTFWASVAPQPIKSARGSGRQSRRSGILVRGERAAYEVSVGEKVASLPGMSRVFGELRIDSIEALQREPDSAADTDAQFIYQPDRSGLNSSHTLTEAIRKFIDDKLGPLVAELDAGAEKKVSPDMRREFSKLAREINSVIKQEMAGLEDPRSDNPSPNEVPAPDIEGNPPQPPAKRIRTLTAPIDFATRSVHVAASGDRTVEVWFDPGKVSPGSTISLSEVKSGPVKKATLASTIVPPPAEDGVASVRLRIEANDAEGRHELTVAAANFEATLIVHVRFIRASGFISNIILDADDWESGSARYNPSDGVVKVFVGRPEFTDAEARAVRRGDKEPQRSPEYRTLVVESVREAALWAAAELHAEAAWDELPREDREDGRQWMQEVRYSFQELDYKLRSKLMKAFAR